MNIGNDILKELDRRYSRTIDLGCGDGKFTEKLIEYSENLTGVDIINLKTKKFNYKKHDMNKKLPFRKNTFDLALCKQVIAHIDDFDYFLSEVYRILKPGGTLILTSENLSGWHNILSLATGNMPFGYYPSRKKLLGWHPGLIDEKESLRSPHVNCFTKRDMTKLLEHYGFRIEKSRGLGWVGKILPVYARYYLIKAKK